MQDITGGNGVLAGIWEFSALSAQFLCESKPVLKN